MTHKQSMALGSKTNLSVVANIKAGMVPGFEPISYRERLDKVLTGQQAARRNLRESELVPAFFPDLIGRSGIIHHFRYAILPPQSAAASADGSRWRLSLNITFDGGWEPYMRVIYRDLGVLLDLLFCHCDGYPGSRTSRFEEYCRWVRENEVPGGTFYSGALELPVLDQRHASEVEQVQRETAGPAAADDAIARLRLMPDALLDDAAIKKALTVEPAQALALSIRSLKGLYRLSTYFPMQDGDGDVLVRFAREILAGPMRLMALYEQKDPIQWKRLSGDFQDELNWLHTELPAAPAAGNARQFDPTMVQAQVLGRERATHGCVVLLRVSDCTKARAHIAGLAPQCGSASDGISRLVAFTYDGLAKLDVAQSVLNAMPQEFVDGMHARCGLLGDVRINHPDHWNLPVGYGPRNGGPRVDMKAVHIVVQMRLTDPGNPSHALHPRLDEAVAALHKADNGLEVVAVQSMRSYRDPLQSGEVDKFATGHFGFKDGISQPRIAMTEESAAQAQGDPDLVRTGELFLGYRNERNDPDNRDLHPLLDNGTFLVVRKLRQRVDVLDKVLAPYRSGQRAAVLGQLMGRQTNGMPIVTRPDGSVPGNDFNFLDAETSAQCPYHAHIRLANPRNGNPHPVRIFRRGMSYGPRSDNDRTSERGLMFMAYCASISEQFELIQGWLTGSNQSGAGSGPNDPFLGVPQKGVNRVFRYVDSEGQTNRVDLGDEPLVQLDWGLYLFVPSLSGLRFLAQPNHSDIGARCPMAAPPAEPDPLEQYRQRLDDPDSARELWAQVREHGGQSMDTPYGRLIGKCDAVMDVLRDDGSQYSVRGYGDRMSQSVGLNLLGMDKAQQGKSPQLPINGLIEAIHERQAFDLALEHVMAVLDELPKLPDATGTGRVRRSLDLVSFSDQVLAALCKHWVGLPDGERDSEDSQVHLAWGGRLEQTPKTPRCPGNLFTASRFIFSPHPRNNVQQAGQDQGRAVLAAVENWLATKPTNMGELGDKIRKSMPDASNNELARGIAGVLLGFPPTVHGNFIRTMETWIDDDVLWEHQHALLGLTGSTPDAYDRASKALRASLMQTMRQRPVPEMLWRSPVTNKREIDRDPENQVVLGITSALTNPQAPDVLMFGRAPGNEERTTHGCPGYEMGMGVMLAMLAGLMQAGTLRPTGSPVLLILTPKDKAAPGSA